MGRFREDATIKKLQDSGSNEVVFVLREQDISAPGTIVDWIARNIESAKCPDEKLREAFEVALQMRKCTRRKVPD